MDTIEPRDAYMRGPIVNVKPRMAINQIKLTKEKIPVYFDITLALFSSFRYSGSLCKISEFISSLPKISFAF